ncbi:MAG: hypothetical protein WEF50_23680 [Myxococcota bacterium]
MGGLTATLALFAFVPLAVLIFGRWPRAVAASVVVLAGSLLLPEQVGFKLPVLPLLEKENVTYLGLLLGALVHQSRAIQSARPGTGPELLLVPIMLATIGTVLVNATAVWDEGRLEPALGGYDVVVKTVAEVFRLGLPFFLGRALFRTRDDLRVLLVMLGGAGIVYTVLILIEVGLSLPFRVFQLSYVLYGFSAGVSYRWGVIQPIIFMEHGLSVATFMAASLLAVVGLLKARLPLFRLKVRLAWAFVYVGLVLSRNVAGIVYGTTLSAVIAFLSPKTIARVAVTLALLVCTYPALRMYGLFPFEQILELAGRFDEERKRSLEGRFYEEEYVVELMEDRFLWGWGNISRVPGAEGLGGWEAGGYEGGLDGYWIIEFGVHGALGLELRLVLLLLPVFVAWRTLGRLRSKKAQALLAALMAIVAMRCVDMLPNGWWNNLPVFLSGALYGLARNLGNERFEPSREAAPRAIAPR